MPSHRTRFVSDTVSWELWERAPAPALRPHVLGYCGYREWGSAGFRRLEIPSDEVHVVLSFGPRIYGLRDQDYGSRDYSARDPEGNLSSFGTYAPG